MSAGHLADPDAVPSENAVPASVDGEAPVAAASEMPSDGAVPVEAAAPETPIDEGASHAEAPAPTNGELSQADALAVASEPIPTPFEESPPQS
jgi:hypothetical protein